MQVRRSLRIIERVSIRTIGVHALDSVLSAIPSSPNRLLRHPVIFWMNRHSSFYDRLSTIQECPSQFLR